MASLLSISQKCQYALSALLELAKRHPSGNVTTIAEISELQNIPIRFLEQILAKIKAGGYILSKRGKQGGYVMAKVPSKITIGEIIRFIDGPDEQVRFLSRPESSVFNDIWQQARHAISDIFDTTTFQDLIDRQNRRERVVDFSI